MGIVCHGGDVFLLSMATRTIPAMAVWVECGVIVVGRCGRSEASMAMMMGDL